MLGRDTSCFGQIVNYEVYTLNAAHAMA